MLGFGAFGVGLEELQGFAHRAASQLPELPKVLLDPRRCKLLSTSKTEEEVWQAAIGPGISDSCSCPGIDFRLCLVHIIEV